MDRLETHRRPPAYSPCLTFIFQYGQIRNKLLDLFYFLRYTHLYSSMDRLETAYFRAWQIRSYLIYIPVWIDQKLYIEGSERYNFEAFIFQYGQIRNFSTLTVQFRFFHIYIPVWIDQKLLCSCNKVLTFSYLYSSMDRLETGQCYLIVAH